MPEYSHKSLSPCMVAMPGNKLDSPFEPRSLMPLETLLETLSKICRWNGRSSHFFSVLDHSLLLAELVPDKLKLQALVHDFAEAYIGDWPQPVKEMPEMAWLKDIEDRLNSRVWQHYAGISGIDPLVWEMDSRLAATEAEYLGLGGEWNMRKLLPGIPASRFFEGGASAKEFVEVFRHWRNVGMPEYLNEQDDDWPAPAF